MSASRAEALIERLAAAGARPTGIASDSRLLAHGELFVAWPGVRGDGRQYIADALSRGASAVLYDEADGFAPGALPVPALAVPNLRALAGHLAHRLLGRPSSALWMAGVTGTNGKTTVSQWIMQALNALEVRCGVIGTLGRGLPGALLPIANTTPDAVAVHGALAELRGAGAQAVAMEVSSIGLDQDRVAGVEFDVAVFTNLTRDHLEYHHTMEAYAAAKARLFDLPELDCSVINVDDAFGRGIASRLRAAGRRLIPYARAEGRDFEAPVLVADAPRVSPSGTRFTVSVGGETAEVAIATVGAFNISNALAVIGALIARGTSLEQAAQATSRVVPPPGRMQLFGGVGEPLVIVDYAHTPDALAKVLEAARDAATRRGGELVCVFGCGGDRDAGKRPMMGEVAAQNADRIVVTSDNPRSEDPASIAAMVVKGAGGRAQCELDRATAIRNAVTGARADDVVVVAGKGHEAWQEIAGVRHPFSDAEQVAAALTFRRTAQETAR